jgi:hypothetical protein
LGIVRHIEPVLRQSGLRAGECGLPCDGKARILPDKTWRWKSRYGNLGATEMYWLYLTTALACAGFVQGLCGFGFGMVSMSLMPLFMGIKQAAIISTAFTLMATLTTYARHYRAYNWRLGAGFAASLCAGLPLGVYLLQRSSEELLTRLMGAFMLTYVVREFIRRGKAPPRSAGWTIPWGLFSGAMSGAFNLGGIPSAAYAYAQTWSRDQIMAFLQVTISLSCVLRMFFYQSAGLIGGIAWPRALILGLPVYGAIWLGHLTLKRLHPHSTRKGIFVFIGVSGAYYLFFRHGAK